MSDSVTLEYGAGQFSTSPKFAPYDMIILALDENNYISSPGAKILEVTDSSAMTDTSKSYAYTGSERGYTTNKWYSYSGSAWVAESNYTPWANRNTGTYTFTWNTTQNKWRYNTSSTYYTTEQLYSTYGIEVHFASVTGFADQPKAGDVITVVLIKTTDSNVNDKQNISLNITMTRSGTCMEAACPLVKPAERQSVADNLLKDLYGYEYQPYSATTAIVDPAAEIGDAIHAYGYYSGIYEQELTFDSMMASDIGAPWEEEVDNELEYESSTDRNYKRKFADIAAEFLIKADEISARVTKEGAGDGFSWSLVYDSWTVKKGNTEVLKVDSNGLHVTGDGTFTGTIYASAGEFTGDIKGGTIHIGNNFSVDSSGNMNASNATFSGSISGSTITGGTINIGNGNFFVDSNGNLTANNGTFGGNVSAKNVLWDSANGTHGLYSGLGLVGNSITTGQTSTGINTSLGYANFSNGVFNNTEKATYVNAGRYYGDSYWLRYTRSNGGEALGLLDNHTHYMSESNGNIVISGPDFEHTSNSFKIANTQTYKDMVLALTITSFSTNNAYSTYKGSDNNYYASISISAKNADGTAKYTHTETINVTSVVNWARQGYTQGTFTQTSVWLGYNAGYNYPKLYTEDGAYYYDAHTGLGSDRGTATYYVKS